MVMVQEALGQGISASTKRDPRDQLKLLGAALAVIAVGAPIVFLWTRFQENFQSSEAARVVLWLGLVGSAFVVWWWFERRKK
jgi:hypothetical protein